MGRARADISHTTSSALQGWIPAGSRAWPGIIRLRFLIDEPEPNFGSTSESI